jgi:endonuclease G
MKNIILMTSLLFLVGCGSSITEKQYERPEPALQVETPPKTVSEKINEYKDKQTCDKHILKEPLSGTIDICYNYELKSATYVSYSVTKELVDFKNIKDRPRFYSEPDLPKPYQVTYSDYTHTGYDRGHMAPDASFDYSQIDLEKIYSMANIIPQDPNVNRYMWSDAENREREITRKYGDVSVLNIIVFDNNPNKLGSGIAISKGFYKVIANDTIEECYYYDNFVLGDMDKDKLAKHQVSCNFLDD